MDEGVILLWLLPAMVLGGVLRDVIEEEDPCRTYTMNQYVYVDCSDRGISELPDGLNYEADALVLSNNNFGSFPKQLEYFTKVRILDLSGNRISRPLPSYLETFAELKTLNLSNNNYDSWTNSDITFNFQKLDLSKNKINRIDEDAFSKMPSLTFLDLSENRLYDISKTIFSYAKNLDTLILSRNYFSRMPKFQSHSLRNLYLSNCQIASIGEKSIANMSSLLVIDLSINEIEYIPDNFASYTLQELYLSYNEIYTLTDLTFSSLPHLAVLDLRGNEFREVWSTSHFSSNPFLREVRVKGNRWSCEGFSVNLLLTYEFLTKEPPKIADSASLICYTPSNVTQLSWQQAYIRTWHDVESGESMYTMMAVMIGLIIGIVFTSLVCRALMYMNSPDPPRPSPETAVLNGPVTQVDSSQTRIPLREDLPPTYDEALLLPRLNASFHSLPDFIDEEEETSPRRNRRSRSIGDLTEPRPRMGDRRSVRRTLRLASAE